MSDIIARGMANAIGRIPNTQTWIATEGQTVFTLGNGSYIPNRNLITVIIGSVHQTSGENYTETNSTSFTLTAPLPAGTTVYAKWFEVKVPETVGHGTRHEFGGSDEIDITKLKNYSVIDEQLAQKAKLSDIQKHQKIVGKTEGIYDAGAVVGIIGNRESDAKIQVCGFANSSEASKYPDRDSVGLYVSNTGANPTLDVATATYGSNYVDVVGDLSGIKSGMVIDTKHTPNAFSSIVDRVEGNRVYVRDGWYEQIVGGSTTPSTPTNGIGLKINQVTKIWGRNTNVFLDDTTTTKKAVAEEIGLFDSRVGTDSQMWGVDVVNFSTKKAEYGYIARSNPIGYKVAYRAEKSDIAYQNQSDTDNQAKLLSSLFNGIEEYYMTVTGEQSKLKLKIKSYGDGILQQGDSNCSLIITNKTITETFNIISPVNKNGSFLYVCNEGAVVQTIGVIGGGNLFFKSPSATSSLTIPSRGSVTLVSDGAFWFVLNNSTEVSGSLNVTGGVEIGNRTSVNTNYIDFHTSGNDIDYDARFEVLGGTASVGQATIIAQAKKLKVGSKEIVTVVTGTTAPSVIPEYVGQEYMDTTNKKVYRGFGTASAADWVILN